jgi:hypothetical protein
MKKQQQQIIEKKEKKNPKTSSQMERVMMMIPFESPLKSHDPPLKNKNQWCPKNFPCPS